MVNNQLPIYLFHQGTNYCSYKFLGSHFGSQDGVKGVFFRVYAPNAKSISVVGDFNAWALNVNEMQKIPESGIWQCFVENAREGECYKYAIKAASGKILYKADPFAFFAQRMPETASIIFDINKYDWADGEYLAKRAHSDTHAEPMNIYEVNLLSWLRREDGGLLTYKEISKELVKYVKKMGYTHVEIMPITEYPHEPSWGYQVTGYFAPTSRLGNPYELMFLIEQFHLNGIGVILDWVPGHFPKDEHGLGCFDGTPLFEYSEGFLKEHKNWGTYIFDWAKPEVQSLLISSAYFFFEKYHVDGIRVDAVSSMLYLDYDRRDGEWIPNDEGGNVNKSAVAFLQKLNEVVHSSFSGVLMVAEESTAFPGVSHSVREGGLGFDYKWNMGWMNDVLSYMCCDPYFRSQCHNKMNFSMMYAFNENFILPLSHDEVVYGKKSLMEKMPGSLEDKFAQVRALMGYTYSHPGKKLSFMGSEIGQLREWDYSSQIDFYLLEDEAHKKQQAFFKKINEFYLSTPAFYEIEDSWSGFNWLIADDRNSNLFAYERIAIDGKKILVVINFSGVDLEGYRIGCEKGKYKLVLDTDAKSLGGSGKVVKKTYLSKLTPANGKKYSISVTIPRFTCFYLEKTE